MRLSNIISLGERYFVAGIIFAVVVTVLILIGYLVVYKKIYHGNKKITKGTLLWFIVFISYLFIVLGATLLNRGNFFRNTPVQPLFYSYKEAWNNFSAQDWREIILNILMFVPFGFLLPLGMKWFRQFWKTYLAGLLFTLVIETLQLVLKRGIFELDDILDNAMGAMIGYGCFAILMLIVSIRKKKQKNVKATLALQLPLIIVILSFTTIFVTYANQELGNLPIAYISKLDEKNLAVTTDEKYNTERGKLTVYKTRSYSQKETRQIAEQFFEKLGDSLDENRTDLYDNTAVYYGTSGNSYWIDYLGGTYHYSDYSNMGAKKSINTMADALEEDIRTALKQYEITLPDGLQFTNNADGTYTFTANHVHANEAVYEGTFTCDYYENGKMGDIRGNILECETYKDFPIISEADAYKMVEAGKFSLGGNYGKISIKTGKVSLKYIPDTKGYCQPVYVFMEDLNGKHGEISVPAIR